MTACEKCQTRVAQIEVRGTAWAVGLVSKLCAICAGRELRLLGDETGVEIIKSRYQVMECCLSTIGRDQCGHIQEVM